MSTESALPRRYMQILETLRAKNLEARRPRLALRRQPNLPVPRIAPLGALAIDHDQEDNRVALARVEDRMRHVGAVAGRSAWAEFLGIGGRLDAHTALLHREKLPRAFEVGRAAQSAAGLQPYFVKLHVLLQIQIG